MNVDVDVDWTTNAMVGEEEDAGEREEGVEWAHLVVSGMRGCERLLKRLGKRYC